MSKTEWFRRTTWSDADREDFNAHLKRSRGARNKAQYLRIQACHLAEAGRHAEAIELLDRLFAEFPETFELAQSHAQKADALAALGQIAAAIEEYRAALQTERDFPQVRTNAWLHFGWLVVERELTDLYEEAARTLQEFRDVGGIMFAKTAYAYCAVQALLLAAGGDKARAREFARRALAEADKVHSGFRYHPTLGLVGSERHTFEERLKALADMSDDKLKPQREKSSLVIGAAVLVFLTLGVGSELAHSVDRREIVYGAEFVTICAIIAGAILLAWKRPR
jgi:tetratricopeptide (TPR) repeat protein